MEQLDKAPHAKSFSERTLWAPKLMYFMFAAAQASYTQYSVVFFERTAQFTKFQIGILQTIPCLCALLGPPMWGLVADRLQSQRTIHVFIIVAGAVLMYAVQFVRDYHLMVALMVIANMHLSPTWSFLDHAVLVFLDRVGGEYGRQRLWAAIGFGLGAYFTGLLVKAFGIESCFVFQLIVSLASLLVLQFIPAPRVTASDDTAAGYSAVPKEEHTIEQDHANPSLEAKHEEAQSVPSMAQGFGLLCARFDVLCLLVVIFFMGGMFGAVGNFLPLDLFNLSGDNPMIIGIDILCETSSEIPAFFFAEHIIKSLGTVNVLVISIFAYVARITCYFLMKNAWTAIPFAFLHGATYGLMWASCTRYIYAAAPKGLECTVVGILSAMHSGLGRGIGTIIGGYVYHNFGAKRMWLMTEMYAPLALLSLTVFWLLKSNQELDETKEILEQVDILTPLTPSVSSVKSTGKCDSYEELE